MGVAVQRNTTRRAAVQKARRRVPGQAPQSSNGQSLETLRRINSRQQLKQIIERRDHDGSRAYVITPELATWLLEINTGNRKISPRRVERYKHLIEVGLWLNTGEPIIVSADGILNEGQHRLLAIREQGEPVPCDIRFGIARAAFAATGQGATRSVGNVLEIEGDIPYTTNIAAAARLVRQFQMGLPGSMRVILSSQEVLADVRRWQDGLVASARLVIGLASKHGMRFGGSASIAFAFLAARQKNEATVAEFMEVVASGLAQVADNPARRLYERFRRESTEGVRMHSSREGQAERLALFIKAWTAWNNNERMTGAQLRWRSRGPQAEAFPEMPGIRL